VRSRDWLWTSAGIGLLVASRLAPLGGPGGWLASHPAATRLVDVHQPVLALAAAWAALRGGKLGSLVAVLFTFLAAWDLLEARLSAPLGVILLILLVIAISARPRPNRSVMAHCLALAGLGVTVAAATGL
jgi:hypothetical protein